MARKWSNRPAVMMRTPLRCSAETKGNKLSFTDFCRGTLFLMSAIAAAIDSSLRSIDVSNRLKIGRQVMCPGQTLHIPPFLRVSNFFFLG